MQFRSSGFGIVYATKVLSQSDGHKPSVLCPLHCVLYPRCSDCRQACCSWVGLQDEQRIVESVPGRLHIIEGCVSTNATYGTAFRPLTLYRLEASESGGTLLTISAQIVFVRQINSLIRALIDRAADGGMRSNFAAVLSTLAEQAAVSDGKDVQPERHVEEPLRPSDGAASGQASAQTATAAAREPASAPTSDRMAAYVRKLASSRLYIATAADALAGRCGLDAAAVRAAGAVLAALLSFRLLAMLCRSELTAALTISLAVFLYHMGGPGRQPVEVRLRSFALLALYPDLLRLVHFSCRCFLSCQSSPRHT